MNSTIKYFIHPNRLGGMNENELNIAIIRIQRQAPDRWLKDIDWRMYNHNEITVSYKLRGSESYYSVSITLNAYNKMKDVLKYAKHWLGLYKDEIDKPEDDEDNYTSIEDINDFMDAINLETPQPIIGLDIPIPDDIGPVHETRPDRQANGMLNRAVMEITADENNFDDLF